MLSERKYLPHKNREIWHWILLHGGYGIDNYPLRIRSHEALNDSKGHIFHPPGRCSLGEKHPSCC